MCIGRGIGERVEVAQHADQCGDTAVFGFRRGYLGFFLAVIANKRALILARRVSLDRASHDIGCLDIFDRSLKSLGRKRQGGNEEARGGQPRGKGRGLFRRRRRRKQLQDVIAGQEATRRPEAQPSFWGAPRGSPRAVEPFPRKIVPAPAPPGKNPPAPPTTPAATSRSPSAAA